MPHVLTPNYHFLFPFKRAFVSNRNMIALSFVSLFFQTIPATHSWVHAYQWMEMKPCKRVPSLQCRGFVDGGEPHVSGLGALWLTVINLRAASLQT